MWPRRVSVIFNLFVRNKNMRFPNRLSFLVLALLLISGFCIAAYPTLTSRVTDQAGVLSTSQEADLLAQINTIERNSTVQIAILIIPSLNGEDIETYSVKTFEANGIGRKDVDNGMLVVVSVGDKKYRVETGYGLEGTLASTTLGRMTRADFDPNFENADYFRGLSLFLTDANSYLARDPAVVSQYSKSEDNTFIFVCFGILILIIILSTVFGKEKFTGGGGSGYQDNYHHSSGSSRSRSSSGSSFGGGRSGGGGHSGGW